MIDSKRERTGLIHAVLSATRPRSAIRASVEWDVEVLNRTHIHTVVTFRLLIRVSCEFKCGDFLPLSPTARCVDRVSIR